MISHTPRSPRPEDLPELLPARMLNAFVYCPRLFHLEWVQQEWDESADTIAGSRDHERVDVESGKLPDPDADDFVEVEARSVLLSAPVEGLIARMDIVEAEGNRVVPVDYKHGRAPEGELEVWESDRAQIAAQALVLRENGYECDEGILYYVGSRRRVSVSVDDALLEWARERIRAALEAAAAPSAPAPLEDSERCVRCSLVGICLPDEHNCLAAQVPLEDGEVRRLIPARDDALPVYVQAFGAKVSKSDDELEIWEREKGRRRVRLLDVSQLSVFGNVTLTQGAITALLGRGVPICHFSFGGWFYGITHTLGHRNSHLRVAQYETTGDERRCLELARGMVARKIRNCRTLLRRNARSEQEAVLAELKRDVVAAESAVDVASLLGIEGMAARRYFGAFPQMLQGSEGERLEFAFETRNRRPPRDPVNALLSLAYSVLAKDWTVVLYAVGLDPFLGFYHRPRFGRPALALDLMEEFRPLVSDSVVLQLINNGEVRPTDFLERGGGVALKERGRKAFFAAYERRMNQLVTHPTFGYQISYRRLLEVQSRLLSRHLLGELGGYEGFVTR